MDLSTNNIIFALLSFGNLGMELIGTTPNLNTFDKCSIINIGNYYSIITQQMQDIHSELFGPLPVSTNNRNEYYLLIYCFNTYDPKATDPRLVENNGQTKAEFLILYPREYNDAIYSCRNDILKQLNTFFDNECLNFYNHRYKAYKKSNIIKSIHDFNNDRFISLQKNIITSLNKAKYKFNKNSSSIRIIS